MVTCEEYTEPDHGRPVGRNGQIESIYIDMPKTGLAAVWLLWRPASSAFFRSGLAGAIDSATMSWTTGGAETGRRGGCDAAATERQLVT